MKIIGIILMLCAHIAFAEHTTFTTTEGNDIEMFTYPVNSKELLIYLPGQRGLGQEYVKWANELQFDGVNVWALDLHESYMLSHSNSSVQKFNIQDVLDIITQAEKTFDKIYLLSASRGAKFALKVAYQHQINNTQHKLKGIILHSPHLIKDSVDIGEEASYERIAKFSNLPIYMIIAQYGTKFARAQEIATILQTGGSSVFTQLIPHTAAGYFMRSNASLTPTDIISKNKLATQYMQAIKLFKSAAFSPPHVMTQVEETATKRTIHTQLSPQNFDARALVLPTLTGAEINLADYKNKVVLLNFWASWCKPCVKEIPSITRLKQKINNPQFAVITVNIGEEKEKILRFQKRVPFDFPVLLDTAGNFTKLWNVYAYPSNYIIDKGVVKYGYRGALEWDSAEVVEIINSLLASNE